MIGLENFLKAAFEFCQLQWLRIFKVTMKRSLDVREEEKEK